MASRMEYTETQEILIRDTGIVVETLEIEAGAIQGRQDGIVQGIEGGAVRVIDSQGSTEVSRWVEVHVFTFLFCAKC